MALSDLNSYPIREINPPGFVGGSYNQMAPPNYQANTDVGSGFGGPLLNRLLHPGVLEDVSRGGFGGNLLQPQVVADLNRRVASGEITQEQANTEWARMREAEAEAARGRETSSRQFQQHSLTTIGTIAAGGYLGGLAGGATGTAAGGVDVTAGVDGTVSPPLDATQDPLGSGGDPGNAVPGASGRTGTGTPMSRILDGTATTADWLSVGGNLSGTALGIAGSRNAANAYNSLADKYMAFGAPSRARYEASMTPGFDPTTIPGYSGAVDTASKGILARLSAAGGNPYGNPGGLIEANKQIISGTALPAIDAYQRLNAGTGGYAGFNAAAPGAATAGIGAQGGVYNAIGSGLAGLLNPQPSLYDTLARLGVQGLS